MLLFKCYPNNQSYFLLPSPFFQVGELCYRKQTGSKIYDMAEARAYRQDVEVETVLGNISSVVSHIWAEREREGDKKVTGSNSY